MRKLAGHHHYFTRERETTILQKSKLKRPDYVELYEGHLQVDSNDSDDCGTWNAELKHLHQ